MLRLSFVLVFAVLGGCATEQFLGQTQPLQTHSLGLNKKILLCNSTISASMPNMLSEGELLFTDIPLDLLDSGNFHSGQILRLQLLWIPTPGKTPLSSTSTNVSIEQIIIADGEVGVYAGAGFGWPSGSIEEGLSISMEDATIVLQSSTSNFKDELEPAATMIGQIYAPANIELAEHISAYATAYVDMSQR